jgi:hypothetical protein
MKRRALGRGMICWALLLPMAGALSAQAPAKPVTDQEAQKRTIADIRNTGTALFSWLTDQVSAAAAGQSQTAKTPPVHLKDYQPISVAELEKVLIPQYLTSIPKTDGWGHPYEYFLNRDNPLAKQVMAIRSPGRDGKFAANDYGVSSFERWPQKAP